MPPENPESKSWPVEPEQATDEAEVVADQLKSELATARRRFAERRDQLRAIGLRSPQEDDAPP